MDIENLPSSDGGAPSARFGDSIVAIHLPATADARWAHGRVEPGDPRVLLSDALACRRETQAEVTALVATIDRLAPLIAAHSVAAGALAAFDAEETETLRAWAAAASDEPPPVPRTERRAELSAALEVAEQRANAARAATNAAEAGAVAANASLAPITQAIAAAGMIILADDQCAALVARAMGAMTELEDAVVDIGALVQVLLDQCDHARATKNPATAAMVARFVEFTETLKPLQPFLHSAGTRFPKRAAHWQAALAEITKETDDVE